MDTASTTESVEATPLLSLCEQAPNLFAKMESFDPHPVNDRVAREMLDRAAAGALDGDATIGEPASGTTGIGPALVVQCATTRRS